MLILFTSCFSKKEAEVIVTPSSTIETTPIPTTLPLASPASTSETNLDEFGLSYFGPKYNEGWVWVNVTNLNIRQQPGLDGEKIGVATPNSAYYVYSEAQQYGWYFWYQISTDAQQWIANDEDFTFLTYHSNQEPLAENNRKQKQYLSNAGKQFMYGDKADQQLVIVLQNSGRMWIAIYGSEGMLVDGYYQWVEGATYRFYSKTGEENDPSVETLGYIVFEGEDKIKILDADKQAIYSNEEDNYCTREYY